MNKKSPETTIDNEMSETKEKHIEKGRCNHGMARKFISRRTAGEQIVGATFDRRSKQKRDRCPRLCTVHTYMWYVCIHICARVFDTSAFLRAENDSSTNNDVTVDI